VKVLDLFSGIGGFSLGLERTGGFETVAFCEIDPFCRRVLAKHWPGVPIYEDVRTLTAARLAADGIGVDAICGGFPCQDISLAGKGAGIEGERSGLWSEYARLIGELRPRYVLVENVAALLGRGLDRVLGDLAALGYDAEWHCIPASAVGAPHSRDRLWIVGHPDNESEPTSAKHDEASGLSRLVADAQRIAADEQLNPTMQRGRSSETEQIRLGCRNVADTFSDGLQGRGVFGPRQQKGFGEFARQEVAGSFGSNGSIGRAWAIEPDVGRVAHGVPDRMDRLKALGNAVVPQIPELIGRAIMAAEARQ